MPNLTKAQRREQERFFKQGKKCCTKCSEIKSISEFGPSKAGWRGLCPTCKECNRNYLKDWHDKNPEYMKYYLRQWRTQNPEKEAAQTKRWREKNPGYFSALGKKKWQDPIERAKMQEQKRHYYESHREEYRERRRRWRKANPHKTQAEKALRRANGSLTAEEWQALCDQYGNRCLCCGSEGLLTIDHIIPITKGGTSDISNLQPLCRSCNTRKHTQTIDYR